MANQNKIIIALLILIVIIAVVWFIGDYQEKRSYQEKGQIEREKQGQEEESFQPISENVVIPTAQEKQLVEAGWHCDKETIIKLLSDNNSDNKLSVDTKNEFGTTVLMAVSQMGCTDLVKLLIEKYGANVNIENFYGRTALMLADYSSFDTMKILLSSGADVHIKNKCCGSTILMLVAGSYDNYIDVIKLLISYGADVNVKDNEGKTAIDYVQETATGLEWETLPDKKEVIQLLQKEAQQD